MFLYTQHELIFIVIVIQPGMLVSATPLWSLILTFGPIKLLLIDCNSNSILLNKICPTVNYFRSFTLLLFTIYFHSCQCRHPHYRARGNITWMQVTVQVIIMFTAKSSLEKIVPLVIFYMTISVIKHQQRRFSVGYWMPDRAASSELSTFKTGAYRL